MPKRKRDAEENDAITSIQDQALRIRASRLKARYDNGVQQLTAQLKLARGFDRQKMSRRMKQAESDKVRLQRLQAEIQILNDLDEGKVAKNYLLKQCIKTKRIREVGPFRALFGDNPESKVRKSKSLEEANVLGRLFKSNPVSEVLPEIMKGIREVLGLDKQAEPVANGNSSQPTPVIDKDTTPAIEDEFGGFSDEANVLDTDDGQADQTNAIENGSSDELMQKHTSRLAVSSDDDSDEDVVDLKFGQNHDRDQNDMEITTDEGTQSEDDNISLVSPSSSSDEDSQRYTNSKPKASTKPPTFLPTLLHTGYYSGSESEEETSNANPTSKYDPDKAYAASVKPRKNRRGQRERQAIAEKKFGERAKHLLKAQGAEKVHGDRVRLIANGASSTESRIEGWDLKRGAVEASSSSSRGRGRGGMRGAGRGRGKGRDIAGDNGRARADRGGTLSAGNTQRGGKVGVHEKLHPSWEAARKKKLEIANAGASAFTGKKVTFD